MKKISTYCQNQGICLLAQLLFILLVSCDQGGTERPARSPLVGGSSTTSQANSQSKDKQSLGGDVSDEQTPVKKIDGSKLFVLNVRAVAKREQLFLTHNLSYEADGKADYIDYRICPLEDVGKQCPEGLECTAGGSCFPGVSAYNRVRLPLLYAGKVLFKVRACIDRERALTDVVCGTWEEKEFDSQAFDSRVASLMGRAINLKQGLGKLNLDYKEVLEKFVEEARACDALNAEVQKVLDSKVSVVEKFTSVPDKIWEFAGEDVANAIFFGEPEKVLAGVQNVGSEISRQLERACLELGDATHDGVCNALQVIVTTGKGFLSAMSPVTAIGTISNKIHDVYYGTFRGESDKLVPKGCFAEQNLQRSVDAIELQMQAKLQELQVIKQQLQQVGESTVIPDSDE